MYIYMYMYIYEVGKNFYQMCKMCCQLCDFVIHHLI